MTESQRPGSHLMFQRDHVITLQDSLSLIFLSRQRSHQQSRQWRLRCVEVAAAVECGERQGPGLFGERRVNLTSDPHPQGQHQAHDQSRQSALQSKYSYRHWASGWVWVVTGEEKKKRTTLICVYFHPLLNLSCGTACLTGRGRAGVRWSFQIWTELPWSRNGSFRSEDLMVLSCWKRLCRGLPARRCPASRQPRPSRYTRLHRRHLQGKSFVGLSSISRWDLMQRLKCRLLWCLTAT